MNNLSWKALLKQKVIKKTSPDTSAQIQMQRMELLREEFLEETVHEKFQMFRFETYYDCIKDLLYAHLYKKGYSSEHEKYLPLFAKEHLPHFKKENEIIKEVFAMKAAIHRKKPEEIKKYLDNNEESLKGVMEKLKEEL